MKDQMTTIKELRDRLKTFRDARDWAQFHDPKNLAEALSIEASELLEHFLWKSKEEVAKKIASDTTYLGDIKDELADVLSYTLQMANTLDIDLTDALLKKMEKVEKKYPVGKARGKAIKYNRL